LARNQCKIEIKIIKKNKKTRACHEYLMKKEKGKKEKTRI
jgi:hypothetical protein